MFFVYFCATISPAFGAQAVLKKILRGKLVAARALEMGFFHLAKFPELVHPKPHTLHVLTPRYHPEGPKGPY